MQAGFRQSGLTGKRHAERYSGQALQAPQQGLRGRRAAVTEGQALGSSFYSTPIGVVTFLGAGALLLLVLLQFAGQVLAPLLFTYTLAVTLIPLIQALERRGLRRGTAVATVFGSAFLIALLVLTFAVSQLEVFAERIPRYREMLSESFSPLELDLQRLGVDTAALARSEHLSSGGLARLALSITGKVLAQAGSMSIFLFLLLVMAVEAPAAGRALRAHLPPHSPMLLRYRAFLREVAAQYRIATLSNFISAVTLTLAYVAFRIDFALLWGLATFFLSYIPRFGMLLSFIPPVLMAFVQYGLTTSLMVLLIGFVINLLMDNLVTPRLTGKGLSLRTSVIAIGAMVWLWVFGPLGALLSVSMMLFIRMLLASSPQTLPLAYLLSTDAYMPPDTTPPAEPEDKPSN
jgi:predicted PurR-regulated permease PerM